MASVFLLHAKALSPSTWTKGVRRVNREAKGGEGRILTSPTRVRLWWYRISVSRISSTIFPLTILRAEAIEPELWIEAIRASALCAKERRGEGRGGRGRNQCWGLARMNWPPYSRFVGNSSPNRTCLLHTPITRWHLLHASPQHLTKRLN